MSFKGKKVAFVFPGQGSQYVGMGQDFLNEDYQKIFADFQSKTGFDLLSIMRDGPEETLKETKFTQPAILAHSVMALRTFLQHSPTQEVGGGRGEAFITPDFVAGHSLGEFSALVANGALHFADALYLVHKRGEFMIKANDGTPFAMSAILGLEPLAVKNICEEASKQHLVVAANYNTPVQTVISGTAQGVELASQLARSAGAKRVMPLPVGGAFHSPLVQKASQWLSVEMQTIRFKDTEVPVVCNVNALPETSALKIVQNLTAQVTASVQWVETIKYLDREGVEIYIEFGPQKVLSGMISKIVDNPMTLNIDKLDDIQKVIQALEAI